jgi:hypothetical protein
MFQVERLHILAKKLWQGGCQGRGALAGCGVNGGNEFAFGLGVGLTPVAKPGGKVTLQTGVSARIFRMGAEVVSERDMPSVLLAVGWADIKVMWKIVSRRAEGLTAANTQIAPVFISR